MVPLLLFSLSYNYHCRSVCGLVMTQSGRTNRLSVLPRAFSTTGNRCPLWGAYGKQAARSCISTLSSAFDDSAHPDSPQCRPHHVWCQHPKWPVRRTGNTNGGHTFVVLLIVISLIWTLRVLGTGVDTRIDVVLTVREHWSTILTVKCWGSLWLLFDAFSFLGTSVSLTRCLADNMWYCAVPSLTEQVETKPVSQPPKLDSSSETIPYFWDIAWRGFSVPH